MWPDWVILKVFVTNFPTKAAKKCSDFWGYFLKAVVLLLPNFRNFSAINAVNSNGVHIGGLGGFFRSLGALIRTIQPTQVYMVFDGVGSSNIRKNIIPDSFLCFCV